MVPNYKSSAVIMIFKTKTTPNIEPDLALAQTDGAIVVYVNNVHNHRSGNKNAANRRLGSL